MKKILILLLSLFSFFNQGISQTQNSTSQADQKSDLIKKSKGQKTAAWILMGVGLISIASVSSPNTNLNTTSTMAVVAGTAILASIPLFIAAGRNKKKAMKATAYIEIEKRSYHYDLGKSKDLPAISLKFGL